MQKKLYLLILCFIIVIISSCSGFINRLSPGDIHEFKDGTKFYNLSDEDDGRPNGAYKGHNIHLGYWRKNNIVHIGNVDITKEKLIPESGSLMSLVLPNDLLLQGRYIQKGNNESLKLYAISFTDKIRPNKSDLTRGWYNERASYAEFYRSSNGPEIPLDLIYQDDLDDVRFSRKIGDKEYHDLKLSHSLLDFENPFNKATKKTRFFGLVKSKVPYKGFIVRNDGKVLIGSINENGLIYGKAKILYKKLNGVRGEFLNGLPVGRFEEIIKDYKDRYSGRIKKDSLEKYGIWYQLEKDKFTKIKEVDGIKDISVSDQVYTCYSYRVDNIPYINLYEDRGTNQHRTIYYSSNPSCKGVLLPIAVIDYKYINSKGKITNTYKYYFGNHILENIETRTTTYKRDGHTYSRTEIISGTITPFYEDEFLSHYDRKHASRLSEYQVFGKYDGNIANIEVIDQDGSIIYQGQLIRGKKEGLGLCRKIGDIKGLEKCIYSKGKRIDKKFQKYKKVIAEMNREKSCRSFVDHFARTFEIASDKNPYPKELRKLIKKAKEEIRNDWDKKDCKGCRFFGENAARDVYLELNDYYNNIINLRSKNSKLLQSAKDLECNNIETLKKAQSAIYSALKDHERRFYLYQPFVDRLQDKAFRVREYRKEKRRKKKIAQQNAFFARYGKSENFSSSNYLPASIRNTSILSPENQKRLTKIEMEIKKAQIEAQNSKKKKRKMNITVKDRNEDSQNLNNSDQDPSFRRKSSCLKKKGYQWSQGVCLPKLVARQEDNRERERRFAQYRQKNQAEIDAFMNGSKAKDVEEPDKGAFAACWRSNNKKMWFCSGPLQETYAGDESLSKAQEYSGCKTATVYKQTTGKGKLAGKRITIFNCNKSLQKGRDIFKLGIF